MERLRYSPESKRLTNSRKNEHRNTGPICVEGAVGLKLPEEKRCEFKEPKGKLFNNSEEAYQYIDSLDYEKMITVGDRVSATFIEGGYEPELVIVDYIIERNPAAEKIKKTIKNYSLPEIKIKNPAGALSKKLWNEIKNAKNPKKIVVDGEEDLATLPATLFAPNGSIVIYGQPKKGLVVVEVTEEKKEEFEDYAKCLVEAGEIE